MNELGRNYVYSMWKERFYLHSEDKNLSKLPRFTGRVEKQKGLTQPGFFKSTELSVKALYVRFPQSSHIY